MTGQTPGGETPGQSPDRTPEEIEAEIAHQRAVLAGTVTELRAKLDVKSRARRRVDDLGGPVVLGITGGVLLLVVVVEVWRRRH